MKLNFRVTLVHRKTVLAVCKYVALLNSFLKFKKINC